MPSPALDIRAASPDDAAAIARFGARTFRDTYTSISDATELDDYIASSFTLAKIETQLRDPDSSFFLAFLEDRLVGYVMLRAGTAPACVVGTAPIELSRLYLDRAIKGAGYGSTLMRMSLDEAQRHDRQTMWLGVYSENTRARAFYTAWGFKDVGSHEFEFGGRIYNDPVMARPVSDSL